MTAADADPPNPAESQAPETSDPLLEAAGLFEPLTPEDAVSAPGNGNGEGVEAPEVEDSSSSGVKLLPGEEDLLGTAGDVLKRRRLEEKGVSPLTRTLTYPYTPPHIRHQIERQTDPITQC